MYFKEPIRLKNSEPWRVKNRDDICSTQMVLSGRNKRNETRGQALQGCTDLVATSKKRDTQNLPAGPDKSKEAVYTQRSVLCFH